MTTPNASETHKRSHLVRTPIRLRDPLQLVLPRSLWRDVHIGDRVMLETDVGDRFCALPIECGPDERPYVTLPCAVARDARTVTVRRAEARTFATTQAVAS